MFIVSYLSGTMTEPIRLFSSRNAASARREHDYWVREFCRRAVPDATITTWFDPSANYYATNV